MEPTEFVDIALWAALVFSFAFAAFTKGLKRIVPTLSASALTVAAIAVIGSSKPHYQHLTLSVVVAVTALIAGAVFGWLYKSKASERTFARIRLGVAQTAGDWRIIVIFVAVLVAVLATYYFGRLVAAEDPRGFWHGFYEAWTAAIVFFGILGVAGTIVSLARPEQEEFESRVRILCRGRDDPTVDYIREKSGDG